MPAARVQQIHQKGASMTIQQLQRLLDSPSLSPDRAAQLYLFSCASGSHYPDLAALRRQILDRWHLSEEELESLIEDQEARWSARQEKAEDLLRESDWMKRFEERFAKRNQDALAPDKAVDLMTTLLSLVLQNASILSCSNRMHRKDVLCLLDMLEDTAFLKPLSKHIQKPILDCSRRIYPPFSEEYVVRILALVQNLSLYYLQALMAPQSGLLSVIVRTIRVLSRASTDEIAEFINPPKAEAARMSTAGIHFEEPRSLQKNSPKQQTDLQKLQKFSDLVL